MKKIVVTGGTGFLGMRLCEKLNELGYRVVALGRNSEIGLELEKKGIIFEKVDLTEKEKIEKVMIDADIVFHCGAKSSLWGKYKDFYDSNVIGTKNVIEAVKKNGVERLIYTSSPTIYYDNQDFYDFNEVSKKPKKFINDYAKTKWMAQDEIDKAFKDGVNTISIIPRGIFGPGDTSIFPRFLQTNEKNGIPLINNGQHIVELTYIDNVVDALILCIETEKSNFGKKYFITNGERVIFKELLEKVFTRVKVKPKFKKISYKKLRSISIIIEFIYKILNIEKEPPITKYAVEILCRNQSFDIRNTVSDLGYTPKITVNEGIEKFGEWWLKNGKKV